MSITIAIILIIWMWEQNSKDRHRQQEIKNLEGDLERLKYPNGRPPTHDEEVEKIMKDLREGIKDDKKDT